MGTRRSRRGPQGRPVCGAAWDAASSGWRARSSCAWEGLRDALRIVFHPFGGAFGLRPRMSAWASLGEVIGAPRAPRTVARPKRNRSGAAMR